MSIYTRTGDKGMTSLFGGNRILKCEELVDVYGSIDELNSWIGLISSQLNTIDVREFLQEIQADLFTIGSCMAGWKGDLNEVKSRVPKMEARIDQMEKELPELSRFIIPGGSRLASLTHIVRSICRRVERQMVKLVSSDQLLFDIKKQEIILQYLNRLSDLLFILARFINKLEKVPEITWSGHKNSK